ncbi:MAG: molybdopterin-dependent oxidoreductase [Acidimicrobiaceae bacterium]|nr:molybdopterin-dependent oxidoreductase [Acidimicrobiaceae bacterium]
MPATSAPVPTTTRVVHGTCHHDCPDSCGWQVTVDDGVAVQLRGNAAHPYSAGELCPKVNRFLDRVYSPDRITTPLRRVGAKGEARFEPISWDDALDEIGRRLRAIVDTHGPGAVMPFISAGNQSSIAILFPERFWNRLGAIELTGALCGAVAGAGTASALGTGKALDPVEVRHSKLILLWGTNTRLTNRHLWPFIEAARADGAQVVVIDPIRTITADSADWFVQPLPGTDVALMLGMMHVLVRDGLVDHDWVADHTIGFDELCDHVAEWTPVRAAEVCGIDAADVERLATMYGTIRPAAIRTLIGAEHHEHGAMFFRTLACLPALVGAWRDRGGGFARSVGVWSNELVDGIALMRPDLRPAPRRQVPMVRLAEALDPTSDQPVHALFVIAGNPLVVVPDAEGVRRGLARDDLFTVVHEQFLTDTARYADIVLPATTQIESLDIVPAWGHRWLGWNEPAIDPVGESVSNSDLHRRLARAMGFTDAALHDDDEDVIRSVMPGVDVDELRRTGWVEAPYPADGRPYADGGFPTPSGKVELRSERLAADGHPALPTYLPARESASGDPDLAARHPFALLTPKHHTRFLNSSYSALPKHGPLEGGPFVEMVAEDARRLGLTEGQCAVVWNDRASLEVPVRITTRLRRGVVAIPWGWWSQHHADGRTANALTNPALTDWGGGVAYSDTLVAVRAR